MSKDEALKLALEALEDLGMKHFESTGEVLYKETFTAIKEALAQPEYQSTADKSKLEKVPAKGTLLAQTEQEPVKFEAVWDSGPTNKDYEDAMRLKRLQQLTTPPQRKPLTDEELKKIWYDIKNIMGWYSFQEIARVIEVAHGIKGEA